MVFQLVVVLVIPIILGIVVVQPFDAPEEFPEIDRIPDKPIPITPEKGIFYYLLMIIRFFS